MLVNILVILLIIANALNAFNIHFSTVKKSRNGLNMEYIPDGLSKEQWADLKRRVLL
jgi:hypothetical protein